MSNNDQQTKKPRVIISGVAMGVALFALTFALFWATLPPQSEHDPDLTYGYVYSGTKSSSVAFNTSADNDGSYFLFGSSELSTPANVVAQVPAAVFGENNYGMNLTYVGEAYDQSLWHSIAIGAYEPYVNEDRKIVFVVSPTWFEDAGLDEDTFKMRFSYSLYREFCENPAISESSKAHLASRLADFGLDQATINAGLGTTFVDELNNAVFLAADDIKLRKELIDIRENGMTKVEGEKEVPDFEELHYQALSDATINSTNNAWGLDDNFYANNIERRLDRLRNSQEGERFANAEELKDFSFLLKICAELDLDVLVIIPPVHGEFYDYAGVDEADRQACYARIKKLCEDRGITYADFTDREYEQYFLHDIVHPGNTGWVDIEEAIYSFIMDEDLDENASENLGDSEGVNEEAGDEG